MENKYSLEKLREFLDYTAEKGLLNKNTAQSRKQAAVKVLSVLDESEQQDLRKIDRKEVFQRFSNLNSSKFKPSSLKVYQSRLSSALDDFLEWANDPSAFKPSRGRSAKKAQSKSNSSQSSSTTFSRGSVQQRTSEPESDGTRANQTPRMSIPIPIRPDCIVECSGLPTDLTSSEAKKISTVIQAYATTEEEKK